MNLPTDPIFYVVAILAISMCGFAKGGFSGIGAAAMPLLVLVMEPVPAAAMMLPILIAQDIVGVWAFRKSFDARTLLWMLPGAFVGVFIGWWFSASVDSNVVRAIVGGVAVVFGTYRLTGFSIKSERPLPQWLATFWGMVSGFTSHVAHAGGPPFQVWAMTRNFPHTVFAGTSSIYFAIINWAKVPAYFALGQFTAENMWLTILFLPVALLTTAAGVWLVKRLDPARFYTIISALMVVVGCVLFWQVLA